MPPILIKQILKNFSNETLYWGTSFNDDEIFDVLKNFQKILRIKIVILKILNNIELNQLVAKDISEGKIVDGSKVNGMQSPRALAIFILGIQKKDMKDILNKNV